MRLIRLLPALAVLASPLLAQDDQRVSTNTAGYSLRPGDVLRITVWNQDDLSGQFQVDENGIVHYPLLGEIPVAGQTVADLRTAIRAGLSRLFEEPFITVTPLFRMAVLGNVRSPGLYTADPTMTIFDVVALAGGPDPEGDLNRTRLIRAGDQREVSFQREAVRGMTLQELGIRSGDQVIVPRRRITRSDVSLFLQIVQVGLSVAILVTQ